eukprot:TRINITY_DN12210_c0_g1_i3.p3 TRINITY_DN12210_c0_g1~~TRINITY_DN12210_c0_g1_i3.p3  ORF type:complete len:190 (+),score=37.43 TRINITY_DN12210_c0_g1_i3:1-570(+)
MQQYQQYIDAVAMAPGVFGVNNSNNTTSMPPLDNNSIHRFSQQQIALQQQQQQQQSSQQQRKRPRTAPTRKTQTDTERRSSLGCNSGGTNGGRKSKSEDKVCNNCGTRKTPFWRKDKIDGHPLCNACGLYFSKNDAPRPAILWKNNEDTNDQQKNNNNNNNIGMKTEPVLPIVQPMVQTIQYAGLFQIL